MLEAFEPAPWPVSLVYSGQRCLPQKLRAFLDFAAPRLKALLGARGSGRARGRGRGYDQSQDHGAKSAGPSGGTWLNDRDFRLDIHSGDA